MLRKVSGIPMQWQGVNCLLMSKYELIIVKEWGGKKMYNQDQRKKKKEWKTPLPPPKKKIKNKPWMLAANRKQ